MKTVILFCAFLLVVKGAVFTAFHPVQTDIVHGPKEGPNFQSAGFNKGQIRIQPASNTFAPVRKLYKIPSIQGRPQTESGFLQRIPSFKSAGNIVEQTKAFANSAKAIFKFLENNDQANQVFDIVFDTSDCLGNTKDIIELMDETVKLVKENSPELIYLEAIVESLENEKNVTKQLLASARMVSILEELIPKLSANSPKLCISSPEGSIKDFRRLGHAMIDIKNHRNIEIDDISRKLLSSSSKIMTETANFLVVLNKSLERFRTNCQDHQMRDSAVYTTIVDIMDSLAALFDVLALADKSKAIKKQAKFVEQIARSFAQNKGLSNLETTLTCDFESGSYGNLVLTLEDLAEIVQSVGIKKLSDELGIDLDFIGDF